MSRTIAHLRNLKSLFSNPKNPSQISLFHSSSIKNSRQNKNDDSYCDNNNNNKVSLMNRDPDSPPKLLVVQPRLRPEAVLKVKLSEALNLANSLEEQREGCLRTDMCKDSPPHIIVQNPAAKSLKADTYFGKGTVDTIKCHLNMIESKSEVDAVFVNSTLSGIQHRNLEAILDKPVLDRVALIIEIFNAHANTKEAKLQAELAALMYQKTRLVRTWGADGRSTFGASGESEVVSARGRGSGGRGFMGGAGETELQLQRRRILERRGRLLSLIEDVRRTRALQRASRKRHGSSNGQHLATVAIVGYTNAGKSTLVSALSDADLYSDDRMFATVDPRLRSVELPSGRKVLLSDTVGFISDLPVQLVEAFHATLEEVVEADLLVHVLDSSAPDLDAQRSTVLHVLEQIGVSEEKLSNMIEVWNKIDLQAEEMGAGEYLDDDGDGLSEVEDDEMASDKTCSFSGEEDDNEASESSSKLHNDTREDEENNDIVSWLSTEETIYDDYEQQCPQSSSRLSMGDEEVADVPPQRELSSDLTITGKGSYPQTEYTPDVKTSGVMGIGLHELLLLIDEKLKTDNVVERGTFDRKWRPPPKDDSDIAVEQ